MDLSVIVCTYNRAGLVAKLLASLSHQEVPAGLDWDIVVVDNNSTDSTRQVINERTATLAVPATYVFERAQGLSHARNAAIRSARGKILAFTDDDVIPEPNWVQSIVAAMERWNADGVGGRIVPKWSVPPPQWLLDTRSCFGSLAIIDRNSAAEVDLRECSIFGANMAFRRELFEELGGFDPSLGHRGEKLYGGEEVLFMRQALEKGKRIMYDPSLVVWHHIPPERVQKRYFRKWRFDKNEAHGLGAEARSRVKLLGVPFWAVVKLLRGVGEWAVARVTRNPDAFEKELELMEMLGFMRGCTERWRGAHQRSA